MGSMACDNFDLIQMVSPDLHGIPRGQCTALPVYRKALKSGFEIQYATVFGLNAEVPMEMVEEPMGNFILIPDAATLVELPWLTRPGRRVGQVLGQLIRENGLPDDACIRHKVLRELSQLKSLGFTLSSSLSYQFKVFKAGTDCSQPFDSHVSGDVPAYGFLGMETELLDLSRDLRKVGVPVEALSHGTEPGMFEVTLPFTTDITMADIGMRLKQAVKAVMASRGYSATFMSQPNAPNDKTSSVCKFRFALRTQDGQNAFAESNKDGISDLCRSWIAGFLHHGPALTALFCPTVNCYRRFKEDTCMIRKLNWDMDCPLTSLNVRVTPGGDVWLETTLPSSACNPYFILLGVVAAGLDGMKKEMTCPSRSSPEALDIPCTLTSALAALEADDVIKEAVTPLMLDIFLYHKTQSELEKFKELQDTDNVEEKTKELEKNMYFRFV